MTTFQILWIIAGFFLGYLVPAMFLLTAKIRVNTSCRLVFGFIGALITYTIFIHR